MTESMPPSPEEIRQLNRSLLEKVIDKAAGDPEWKRRLLDDPDAALMEADFPEAERLREIQASVEAGEADVVGQMGIGGNYCYPWNVCKVTVGVDNTAI